MHPHIKHLSIVDYQNRRLRIISIYHKHIFNFLQNSMMNFIESVEFQDIVNDHLNELNRSPEGIQVFFLL